MVARAVSQTSHWQTSSREHYADTTPFKKGPLGLGHVMTYDVKVDCCTVAGPPTKHLFLLREAYEKDPYRFETLFRQINEDNRVRGRALGTPDEPKLVAKEWVTLLERNAERLLLNPHTFGIAEQEELLGRLGADSISFADFDSVVKVLIEEANPPEPEPEEEEKLLSWEEQEQQSKKRQYHGTGAMDGLHFGYLTGEGVEPEIEAEVQRQMQEALAMAEAEIAAQGGTRH